MQVQQALSLPRRSLSTMIAVLATVIAATLALALAYSIVRPSTPAAPTVVTLHEVGAEQIAHSRTEEGFGGSSSVGGEQIAHDRSEQGVGSVVGEPDSYQTR